LELALISVAIPNQKPETAIAGPVRRLNSTGKFYLYC
jgi:hypothetical protein